MGYFALSQELDCETLFYKNSDCHPNAFFLIKFWQEYTVIEKDFRLMRAQNFKLAVDPSARLSKHVVLLDLEREYIEFARTKAKGGLQEDALANVKAIAYANYFPMEIYRYSLFLALNGNESEGLKEFNKMKAFYDHETYEYYKSFYFQSVSEGHEVSN